MESLTAVKMLPNRAQFVDGCIRKLALFVVAFVVMTSIAAASTYPSENGVLRWKGQNWSVTSGDGFGSAYNNWSKSGENIWIDDEDKLHLTIKKDRGAWHCTQLATQRGYRYGKFTWKVESPVFTLDKNSVLGLFTYIDDNHEIDIEVSRWQKEQNKMLLFTNQPYYLPGNMITCLPSKTANGVTTTESGYDGSGMTLQIDWQPTYIDWKAWDNNRNLIAEAHYANVDRIPSVEQKVMMNLWLKQKPPSDGKDIEVVISDVKIEETPAKLHGAKEGKIKHSAKKCQKKLHSFVSELLN